MSYLVELKEMLTHNCRFIQTVSRTSNVQFENCKAGQLESDIIEKTKQSLDKLAMPMAVVNWPESRRMVDGHDVHLNHLFLQRLTIFDLESAKAQSSHSVLLKG